MTTNIDPQPETGEEMLTAEEILWRAKANLAFIQEMAPDNVQGGMLYGKYFNTKEEMVHFLGRVITHFERELGRDDH